MKKGENMESMMLGDTITLKFKMTEFRSIKHIKKEHIDNLTNEEKKEIEMFVDFVLLKRKMINTNKYHRLDPMEHRNKIIFTNNDIEGDMINPFENIDDVLQYTEELRKKAWR